MLCDEHGTADYCGECVYGPEIERLTAERDAALAEISRLQDALLEIKALVDMGGWYSATAGSVAEKALAGEGGDATISGWWSVRPIST